MIHFDFIVTDEEASAIMEALHQKICKTRESVLDVMVEHGPDSEYYKCHKDWTEGHIQWLQEIQKKMKNKRVE